MTDFGVSAAATIVGNVVAEYVSPLVGYFFKYGKIVEDFKHKRNELEVKRNQVKDDVHKAERRTEKIKKDVQEWLTGAEKELKKARHLEAEIERNKCFNWCPNWGWRYCLSRKVAKNTLCISRLLENSNFPEVGDPASLQGIQFLLSTDVKRSKSFKAAFNGIMKDLISSNGVNVIGLYGMPGVGKTTLVEEVGKQAKEQKLFDKVVIFTASQTPNVNEIQDKIAAILDLKFQTTIEDVKAEELWRRLKGEENILIIIDDVWDRLELKRIGIPFGADHEGCKILLTTRLQDVCTQMDCQEKFPLNIFSESEAWALFKDNAGLENVSPVLNDVAKEVARECNGLPLAIVTMARALKAKTIDEWEVVNQRLKESRHSENQDICGGIYSSLKISYDCLKGNNSRTCLQLCSLFPEDHEIRLEELTIYGFGQGMFHDVNSIEDARREMRVTITNLQKSGLLLETNDVSFVKMHDVVRDFVHWITSEGEKMVLVKSGLNEWPRSESLECYTVISLINSNINNFPDGLGFPKLEAFLLRGSDKFLRVLHMLDKVPRVPSMFFQGMKALKVLIPSMFFQRLVHCRLTNASSLGNLKKLEILAISDSFDPFGFENICYNLMGLITLRLLTMGSGSSGAFFLPKKLLSSLGQLEELNLGLHIKWALIEKSADRASLSELHFLPRLTHLTLHILSKYIPKNFMFPPLQRYDIVVNEKPFFNRRWHKSSRRLIIAKFSLTAFEELFCNVEELALRDVIDLEYLIDTTKEQGPRSTFNNLVRLTLDNMICLKELCHGLPPKRFLQKLEFLTIKKHPNAVFEIAAIKNLKELRVEDCGQLQVIFQMDGVFFHTSEEIQAPLLSSMTNLHLLSLPELRSIWKGASHHVISLLSLREVTIRHCNKLKFVFPYSLARSLPHLQGLHVSHCDGLEQVFCCAEETDNVEDITLPQLHTLVLTNLKSLRNFYTETNFVKLPSLKRLEVRRCGQLTQFKVGLEVITMECTLEDVDVNVFKELFCNVKKFTLGHVIGLEYLIDTTKEGPKSAFNNLKELVVNDCGRLQVIFQMDEVFFHTSEEIQAPLLSSMTILHLWSLPELRSIWKGASYHVISLLSLREVIIRCCNKLKFVFPYSLARSLPHLQKLHVSKCDGLEQVFCCAEETDNVEDITLPQLHTLVLTNLKSLRNFYTETNFVKLPSLKRLKVRRCGQLTQFKVGLEVITMECTLEDADVNVFELFCNAEHLTLYGNMRKKTLANTPIKGD